MKIIHVVYSLEMGGAEVLVAQLCRLQRARGHDVSICAYSKLGVLGESLKAEGFVIHLLGEAHPAITMWRCFRLFLRLRPVVVHCHNPAPTIQAAIGARLSGAPCVISTRHSLVAPPYDVAQEVKYSLLSLACHRIVGICEATCDNLRRAPLSRASHIVRVYNGVAKIDCVARESVAEGDLRLDNDRVAHDREEFTLLFVGRLAAIKDLPTLLHAVALAVDQVPAIRLWIVGSGPAREELEELVVRLRIADRVRFWGQQMDVAPFFLAADVFVMSSLSEGLPMSLLQAMSAGLPAVLTDTGGMGEVVRLAGSGILVPVGDAPAMSRAICQLGGNAALRASFSARALTAYQSNFTIGKMEAAYMEIYLNARTHPGWGSMSAPA